jgi:hypothetical protein
MSSPPHQAYWVACRASCRKSALSDGSVSLRVKITLPMVNAGTAGTGNL